MIRCAWPLQSLRRLSAWGPRKKAITPLPLFRGLPAPRRSINQPGCRGLPPARPGRQRAQQSSAEKPHAPPANDITSRAHDEEGPATRSRLPPGRQHDYLRPRSGVKVDQGLTHDLADIRRQRSTLCTPGSRRVADRRSGSLPGARPRQTGRLPRGRPAWRAAAGDAARARGGGRDSHWNVDDSRTVYPVRRVHCQWRDGGRLLAVPRTSQFRSRGKRRRRRYPVLLCIPLHLLRRPWRPEPGRSAAQVLRGEALIESVAGLIRSSGSGSDPRYTRALRRRALRRSIAITVATTTITWAAVSP